MTAEGRLPIPSMRAHCTPEEWQARIDLAACYRLVDLDGRILARSGFGTLDDGIIRAGWVIHSAVRAAWASSCPTGSANPSWWRTSAAPAATPALSWWCARPPTAAR